MRSFLISHLPIFLTIVFALYSQLIIKWHMREVPELPTDVLHKVIFLVQLLFSPWMISALMATFLGGLTWMAAMTRFDLGYAYLYISLLFILTMLASILLFNEPMNSAKAVGMAFVLIGIVILGYGQQA